MPDVEVHWPPNPVQTILIAQPIVSGPQEFGGDAVILDAFEEPDRTHGSAVPIDEIGIDKGRDGTGHLAAGFGDEMTMLVAWSPVEVEAGIELGENRLFHRTEVVSPDVV